MTTPAAVEKSAKKEKKSAKKRKSEMVEEAPVEVAAAAEATPSPKSIKKVKKEKSIAKKATAAGNEVATQAAAVSVPAEDPALPGDGDPTHSKALGAPAKLLLIPIAKPLADDKLSKKVLKLVKKASKRKQAKRGVKEVVKAIRKRFKGVCVLAGDTSPLDVISHLPILCEDNDIPYVFVSSKEALGAAGLTKRPTCCMLVLPKQPKGEVAGAETEDFATSYADVFKRVKAVQPSTW